MNNEKIKTTYKHPLELHPDTYEGRAILKRYEQRSPAIEPDVPYYPATQEAGQGVKRTEIIINEFAVNNAAKLFQIGFYFVGACACVAGGVWLLAQAAGWIGANVTGFKLLLAALLVVVFIFVVLKINFRAGSSYEQYERTETRIVKNINIEVNA